jgi:Zn-dependent M28 family amino/carboxypeptidase
MRRQSVTIGAYLQGGLQFVLVFLLFSSIHFAQQAPLRALQSDVINAPQLLGDLQILSADDMEGRRPGTPGNARARAYILERFKQSGIVPIGDSYLRPFSFSFRGQRETLQGVNVVGYIRGKVNPERFLVVTAHYDHVGIVNGQIYNGADDNASGVAALFAVGAYFKEHPPDNSILLAALDAEEFGINGGQEFVRNPPVSRSAIVMNVNLDMLCRDKSSTLYATGTYHYPYLRPYLEMLHPPPAVKFLLGHDRPDQRGVDDWTDDSDHVAFHRAGIPFIYFGTEDYDYHHQPTDDYENSMPEFYVGVVETVIQAIHLFDSHLGDIQRAAGR